MAEPPITIRAIHDSGTGNIPPTRVVVHATNSNVGFPRGSALGQALATANYFTLTRSGGSAHYIVDRSSEQHCVPDNVIAWHAPPNDHSIGIEICAEGGNPSVAPKTYTRAQWLDPQVWPAVQLAAKRTRELCDRFAIPQVRLSVADLLAGRHGICGHVDVSNAWHQTDHSDPGPEFPWAEFLAEVHGQPTPLPPAPKPVPVPAPTALPTLTYGMTNSPAVASLQRFLNAYNWVPALPLLPVTGNYLQLTKAVVAGAQRQLGVTGADADGSIVGPRTNAALWARGWRG